MNEWAILACLATAATGAWAFLSVVRDEIRLKTHELEQLAEQVRSERRKRDEDDGVDDGSEPVEVQPAPRMVKTAAVSNAA